VVFGGGRPNAMTTHTPSCQWPTGKEDRWSRSISNPHCSPGSLARCDDVADAHIGSHGHDPNGRDAADPGLDAHRRSRESEEDGLVAHILVMGTVMVGLAYAALFVALDDGGIVTGALIGLVHGVVAGLAMAGMGVRCTRGWTPGVERSAAGSG
jgi:hypothetical protein